MQVALTTGNLPTQTLQWIEGITGLKPVRHMPLATILGRDFSEKEKEKPPSAVYPPDPWAHSRSKQMKRVGEGSIMFPPWTMAEGDLGL